MKTVRITAGDYVGPDLARNRLYRFTQHGRAWEVRWIPGPPNREDSASVDAWSERVLTEILGDDQLGWTWEGEYRTKAEALAAVGRCLACEPDSGVRQHTCGLGGLQELLPRI